MKTNPITIAARGRSHAIQPGRARRSARVTLDAAAPERRARSDAPYPCLASSSSFAAVVFSFLFAGMAADAQVNSGSNGSDGAFNPTTNTVINMAEHPDGICHYTSVNLSNGVTATLIPNANKMPVVWFCKAT